MKFNHHHRGQKPLLHKQTAENVRNEIVQRNLKPHDPVPSEASLPSFMLSVG